ncbi:hypothetical protein ACSQ67_021017 [Phaseolus vulgaris]
MHTPSLSLSLCFTLSYSLIFSLRLPSIQISLRFLSSVQIPTTFRSHSPPLSRANANTKPHHSPRLRFVETSGDWNFFLRISGDAERPLELCSQA